MDQVDPEDLFESGRCHALAAKLLHESSVNYAHEHDIVDVEKFAFNGTFSLSLHYLVGLGFELFLKAAYVKFGGDPDPNHLRTAIGHDLVKALQHAETVGFQSDVENLAEIVGHLSEPYRLHSSDIRAQRKLRFQTKDRFLPHSRNWIASSAMNSVGKPISKAACPAPSGSG
ncbi:hypothetical protein [Tsuneonella sp. HG222]